ncbi:MAG: hypothetical protein AAGA81_04825 [Acidobacteriota bacterium]
MNRKAPYSLLVRSLGFFVVTLTPVTLKHLEGIDPRLLTGELLDSLVTTIFFTLIFAVGSLLAASAPLASERLQLLTGAAAGVALWGLLWLGWSASTALAPWSLLLNCSAIFAAGFVSSHLLQRRTVATA